MKAYTNDGIVDNSTGQCRNSIFIFSGKPRECKTAGMSTSFFNCCDAELGSFGPIQERCGDEDAGTVMGVRGGRCHYVGDYCREKWPLIGCVQRANMYCCFNSKLGRIIQEQGRAQLKTFAGWGGAENPDCRGLTPDEFQMLDFSGIDLSEYFGDVVTKSQAGIQQDMKKKVEDFYRTSAP
ncbi:MAG: conjugal transfer protein TraN [Syntrophales bacterium]